MLELLHIGTMAEAAEEIKKIGACPDSIKIMAPKGIFRAIKLYSVRNAIANILKQEMLSIGGEAAVNAGTAGCVVETTDVLLTGTIRQYQRLIAKMGAQVSESREIAEELKQALSNELGYIEALNADYTNVLCE